MVWKLVKIWLSEKMKSRVLFVSEENERTALSEILDPALLPNDCCEDGRGKIEVDKLVDHVSILWRTMQGLASIKAKGDRKSPSKYAK
jgi:hypothetical protein